MFTVLTLAGINLALVIWERQKQPTTAQCGTTVTIPIGERSALINKQKYLKQQRRRFDRNIHYQSKVWANHINNGFLRLFTL